MPFLPFLCCWHLASLYSAAFVPTKNGINATASLFKYSQADNGSWTKVLTFGALPPSNLAGMLATDGGGKWWLAAGESGNTGQNTLFYAESATSVHRIATEVPLTTMQYVKQADEFLGTWERPGQNQHLAFGALDPYVGKENNMADLSNYSIPWATFGVSALNPVDLAFTFVVGIESPQGGQFKLATIAPNGHGIDVTLGAPCLNCTFQSVLHVADIAKPVVLTMSPVSGSASALYTYSFVPWDVSKGAPAGPILASWNTTAYNTFSATASDKEGVLYASDQFRGKGIVRFKNGQMETLSTSGLVGDVCDLVYVDDGVI